MVDTLVLGTSAQAWEFESLHAQTGGYNLRYALQFCLMSEMRSSDLEFDRLRADAGADFVYFFVHFDNNEINAGWQV